MAKPRGNEPPSPGQLDRLQQLSTQADVRYARPLTARQAQGRIRDLEIRVKAAKREKGAEKRQRRAERRDPLSTRYVVKVLGKLKFEHYAMAKAVEAGASEKSLRPRRDRIAALEAAMDRFVEAPL